MRISQHNELSDLLTQYAARVVKLVRTASVMDNGRTKVDYAAGLKVINDEYIKKIHRITLKHSASKVLLNDGGWDG